MFSLVLNVYANAPTKPKEFPTPLGCGEYDGAEGSWWSTCQKLNSVAAANWWTEQMVGYRFENNTSSSHYLYFKEGGELFGWRDPRTRVPGSRRVVRPLLADPWRR